MRKSSAGSRARALVGAAAMMIVFAAPARATPAIVSFDRSDNDFAFRVKRDGSMPTATSSAVFKPGDKVTFYAYVRAHPDAPEGRRLAGFLDLALVSPRPVRYDGTFKLVVNHDDGSRALRRTKDVRFTLRPNKGERRGAVRFRFDLEPGRYTAIARFWGPRPSRP
jgi:hypothetical protein